MTTVHPPHGTVDLLASCASDLDVVNAARVSYAQQSDWLNAGDPLMGWDPETPKLKDDDAGVLNYMMKHKHGSPFEHNFFKFHVRAPIFVFREWHRHRIGISINEESGRYVELKPDFYLPAPKDCREQVGRPGHYTFVQMSEPKSRALRMELNGTYEKAFKVYERAISEGVAKEVARLSLPVAIYSQMIWSCNARSLMAFLELRTHPTAQREIRDYALVMEKMFEQVMPVTHAAFVANGRIAP